MLVRRSLHGNLRSYRHARRSYAMAQPSDLDLVCEGNQFARLGDPSPTPVTAALKKEGKKPVEITLPGADKPINAAIIANNPIQLKFSAAGLTANISISAATCSSSTRTGDSRSSPASQRIEGRHGAYQLQRRRLIKARERGGAKGKAARNLLSQQARPQPFRRRNASAQAGLGNISIKPQTGLRGPSFMPPSPLYQAETLTKRSAKAL